MVTPGVQALVSVLIPTHNRPEWLATALESARAQTWSPLEIVVCDDGGLPETEAVVRRHVADTRVRYVRASAQGIAENHRRAMEMARGDFVVFLSDDDRLDARFVERRALLLAQDRGAIVAFGGYRVCDEDFVPVRDFRPSCPGDALLDGSGLLTAAIARGWSINSAMFRRSSLQAAWPEADAAGAAFDFALHVRLALQEGARGWCRDWCDVDYRMHSGQTSRGDALLRHFAAGDRAYAYVLAAAMPSFARRTLERDRSAWLIQWGRALAREGDVRGARRKLREAVRIAPLSLLPWRQLAVAYAAPQRLGRPPVP